MRLLTDLCTGLCDLCEPGCMQVQLAYDTWRRAGQRMEQLGHEAQRHRRWKSCQKGFRVRCSVAQMFHFRFGKLTPQGHKA